MIEAVVDTSVLIARETGRSVDIASLPDGLAVSVITIGELRSGVLAADDVEVRDRRLSTLLGALLTTPRSAPCGRAATGRDGEPLRRAHARNGGDRLAKILDEEHELKGVGR